MIIVLALMLAIAAPSTVSRAATNGVIQSVCTFSHTLLYITVSATGVTADTAGGDQIGVLADSHIAWGTIPADGQTHSFTFIIPLTDADPANTVTVSAGSGDGNQNVTGTPFAGGGNYPISQCSGFLSGVPTGFVLRTLLCTTSIYAEPGATPLDATVFVGQTWFVSPLYVVDHSGNHWTEIFDGGPFDGYIPTQCVFFGSGATNALTNPTTPANPPSSGPNSPIIQFTNPF
jgi:hypothetical protein